MEKIIKRAEANIRSAARRHAKQKKQLERGQAWARQRNQQEYLKYLNRIIRQERRQRRTDFEKGPLAPRRDIGVNAMDYGTVNSKYANAPEEHEGRKPKWYEIAEGDRVVVTKGLQQGKIGEVQELDKSNSTVILDGINKIDVSVPKWARAEGQNQSIVTFSKGIPLRNVKLVYPLPDPETGVPRDVIIDRLEPVGQERDVFTGKLDKGQRVVVGTKTIIPWPEEYKPEAISYEDDTLGDAVDEVTYRPHLLMAPMPLGLIDELRSKYSRLRVRHDPDYIRAREEKAAQVERRKHLIKTMRTPLQELAELRLQQKQQREKVLSTEQLAKIGEVISQERLKAKLAVQQMNEEMAKMTLGSGTAHQSGKTAASGVEAQASLD